MNQRDLTHRGIPCECGQIACIPRQPKELTVQCYCGRKLPIPTDLDECVLVSWQWTCDHCGSDFGILAPQPGGELRCPHCEQSTKIPDVDLPVLDGLRARRPHIPWHFPVSAAAASKLARWLACLALAPLVVWYTVNVVWGPTHVPRDVRIAASVNSTYLCYTCRQRAGTRPVEYVRRATRTTLYFCDKCTAPPSIGGSARNHTPQEYRDMLRPRSRFFTYVGTVAIVGGYLLVCHRLVTGRRREEKRPPGRRAR
jgi:hypothetical protein